MVPRSAALSSNCRLAWRLVFLLPLLLMAGCKESDGETLRRVARKTGEKLEGSARPVHLATSPLRGSFSETGLAARVEVRIRNDRYLAGQGLKVRGTAEGTVAVSGTVGETSVKTRALDLAKSTLGVEKVIDEVKVKAAD
jgi:osmotically-inducible protein OsmY